ncbi:hypothetical protein D6810_03320, partial [Candidatus Dojkabacteria bacterium]
MHVIVQAVKALSSKFKDIQGDLFIRIPEPLGEEVYREIIQLPNRCFKNLHIIIDAEIKSGFKIQLGDVQIDATLDRKSENLLDYLSSQDFEIDKFFEQLTQSIKQYTFTASIKESGKVLSVKDGVCFIDGLAGCMYQELLTINGKIPAIALSIERYKIGAVVLGDFKQIKVGNDVYRTEKVVSVPVSNELIGRVIDPLANPLDGKPQIVSEVYYPIEKVAPGVIERKPVAKPLLTGITAIDALIPIGRGQRELILGDRQTGKTSIAIDTIINQRDQNVICIYVSIGQKESKLAGIISKLRDANAMDYTII